MTASLLKHRLQSHPTHPPPAGLRVEVQQLPPDDAGRPLRLAFELFADLETIRLPAPLATGTPRRADGLWQHTCFEAFVAASVAIPRAPYVEFNVAPSGAWAMYRFDGYRAAMRPEPCAVEPQIVLRRRPVMLQVEVALAWPVPLPGPQLAGQPWRGRLGLSAVVEAADGSLSYWALHHPAARPDFHNGEGFVLGIEVAP